jgi:hypothetical protein
MKPLYLAINQILTTLGAERCAAAMGVSVGRAYKYGQPDDANGEAIPVSSLWKLLAFAAADQRPAVNDAWKEIASLTVPPGYLIVDEKLLDRLLVDLGAIRAGKSPAGRAQETLLLCNSCDEPLQVIAATNGSYRYVCRGCGGR